MTAFEELGVMPELGKAVDEMGWLLPTDIQAESIPLILGGGDVLMAAETGSGKTGAFSIPVIQIVHESKTETKAKKGGNAGGGSSVHSWQMSMFDRGSSFAVGPDGLLCQSRHFKEWHGSRSTLGVTQGKYYYEALCKDEGLCRVGWSTSMADLNLGTDKQGFGFGGTGKKSYNRQFDTYGEPFTMHDTIGCYLNMDEGTISYSKNGKDLGQAFPIPPPLMGIPIFAAVVLKNAEIQLNFGNTAFKHPPAAPYKALCQANTSHTAHNSNENVSKSSKPTQKAANAPYAVIIEPSRELAEQTYNNVKIFSKHVGHPGISAVCVIGGVSAADQLREIEQGVDILIGTPGRVDDFISTRKVNLNQVRFLVLDECDGLLSSGNTDFIKRMYAGMSQISSDGKRLQVIVCSATLHNFDVKKLAEKIMHFPTWVDLKGEDAVPETVHHVVIPVQPMRDLTWQGLRKHVTTDGVHQRDNLNHTSDERTSEAIKLLKGEYAVQVIKKHDMDKSIIFCRTKLDCDNLENYFTSLGGGPRNKDHLFSCVCLHGDRRPPERKSNLEKFKQSEVRHLICTDVAARGIDIRGVPYVINVTLPDEKQNYVHRIGRVGRAERMGLAISLVATEQREKVWYHSNCGTRGKGCYNTSLTDYGGCCIWYDEQTLLGDIEQHLKLTIEQINLNMEIPVNEFDGKVVYGKKSSGASKGSYKGHATDLAPAVQELQALEKSAQMSFLMLANKTKQALGGKA